MVDRFETSTDRDGFYDYCLWDYEPVAEVDGKFRSINLLLQSFQLAGLGDRAYELVMALRQAIGDFRTVWGLKWRDGQLGWEFYFYDYMRTKRDVSMTRVLQALQPFAPTDVPVDEQIPYFMFSLDIDRELTEGTRTLSEAHMYVGNAGSTVSSGMAYSVTPQATRLENFYFFFDGRRQLGDAADKIASSAFIDPQRIPVDRILRPELRDCRTICVANKQHNDCVYFSEVNVKQLLAFLEMLDYPQEIVGFVRENESRLDHLLYDVGFDYRMESGDLVVVKSGYYGVF